MTAVSCYQVQGSCVPQGACTRFPLFGTTETGPETTALEFQTQEATSAWARCQHFKKAVAPGKCTCSLNKLLCNSACDIWVVCNIVFLWWTLGCNKGVPWFQREHKQTRKNPTGTWNFQRGRETDRQRDRQRARQRDKQRDRETERQRDTERERERESQRESERERGVKNQWTWFGAD